MRQLEPSSIEQARAGDRRSLARLITAVEERVAGSAELSPVLAASAGHAHVVGVTGAPGVGKSTTTAALLDHWRSVGRTVGVIAVDPSSPFTGGALLGDRIRMARHETDPGVFIRSMAARGQLGGLAAATPGVVRVLDACGFDVVLIETVGVGQNEIDVVRCADTVVILQAPGMGDRIQAQKAGLLEIGDIIAVNKADLPGANVTSRELRTMVANKAVAEGEWRPPVLLLSAASGDGVDQLAAAIQDHHVYAVASGALTSRRLERHRSEILGLAIAAFTGRITGNGNLLDELARQVLAGSLDPLEAARRIAAS